MQQKLLCDITVDIPLGYKVISFIYNNINKPVILNTRCTIELC